MATRDQIRAALAFKHVSEISEADKGKYATMVHKLPSLLHSAGLCQTLAFVESRNHAAPKKLLDHLAAQLSVVDNAITTKELLLNKSRTAALPLYLQLTDEALACAAWYRRMVQGILKIEAGEGDDE